MNSSEVTNPSGVIRSKRRRAKAANSPASQKQQQLLARLEQKYGGRKKLRIDAAHESVPGPISKPAMFRVYTDWLSKLNATPESMNDISAPTQAPAPIPMKHSDDPILTNVVEFDQFPPSYTQIPPSELEFGKPEMLTADMAANVAKSTNRLANRGTKQSGLSIPVDKSTLSLERLQRVDAAHAKIRSKLNNLITHAVEKPEQPANTSATSNANIVTGLQRPAKPIIQNKIVSQPGADLPASAVAWEVDDFTWPDVISEMNLLHTQAARRMAEATMSSLSATEQRVAVLGSGRGPGTTTISMYVAKILAQRGQKVLLVDADIAKPDLTQRLGLPAKLSWMNIINENRKCSEAIIRSANTGICVMPVSKVNARVTWPDYIYDCLAGILDGVRKHFDVVIIDIGPTSQLIRELSVPNLLVDTAMLVHNVRIPDRMNYSRNQNELNSFGIKKLVVAENFAARKAA